MPVSRKTLGELIALTTRLSHDRELEDALQQVTDAALHLARGTSGGVRSRWTLGRGQQSASRREKALRVGYGRCGWGRAGGSEGRPRGWRAG